MKSKIHEHQKNNYSIVSKKQILVLGILVSFFFSACSKDSDTKHENILQGEWKLINVSGSIVGFIHDFEPGTILWNFNTASNTLTIVNNNTNSELTDLFESGQYNFQIEDSANSQICSETLEIQNIEMGCFSVANDTLTINQTYADGYSVKLIR